MRFLKLRKSEKSISDLEGFADISNEKLRLCLGAQGCSEEENGNIFPPLTPPFDPPPPTNPGKPSGGGEK